jgi:hypothetical protein
MRAALSFLVCLFAVGCMKVNVQRVDQVARPAQAADDVAVLLEEPAKPYTVIATVESSTEEVYRGFDDLRREMVAEAARLGGDALILSPEATKSHVIFVPTPIFWDEKKLTGEVIVFHR